MNTFGPKCQCFNYNDRMTSFTPLPPQFAALTPGFSVPDPADSPALRWGILGPGGIAHTFISATEHTASSVTAVGSRSLDRAAAFADEYGIQHAYGSYEELVASDEIDAVYVATPHIRHREDALLALRAGKPVLVEKSFTMNRDQAVEVFDEARARGLFAMEAMWSRHLPHYRWIRAVIESGNAGRLVSAQADHSQALRHVPRLVEASLGGSAMLDLGVYSVHFVHHALGKPSELSAFGIPVGDDPMVDASLAILGRHAESGALSVASCSLEGQNATAGSLTFENLSIEIPEQFYRPAVVTLRPKDGDQPTVTWDARVPGGFQYQIAEAARCIAAGLQQSPVVSWQDTLDVMEIMDQARGLAAGRNHSR